MYLNHNENCYVINQQSYCYIFVQNVMLVTFLDLKKKKNIMVNDKFFVVFVYYLRW